MERIKHNHVGNRMNAQNANLMMKKDFDQIFLFQWLRAYVEAEGVLLALYFLWPTNLVGVKKILCYNLLSWQKQLIINTK